MTELDFIVPPPDPTRPEREPRRSHRHDYGLIHRYGVARWEAHGSQATRWGSVPCRLCGPTDVPVAGCVRCGAVQDLARSRRGRTARSRGNAIELETAKLLGVRRVGQYGGTADIETPSMLVQVKSGPAWYSVRAERELDGLPVNAEQVAVLVAVSTPGPGRKRRRQVRMSLGDLVRRFGEHAQAVVWFEDVTEETP